MKRLPSLLLLGVAALTILSAAACSNPDKSKQKHVQKADAYAAQGKYREAILEYKNAIKIDARFGEARYKLAGAYLHVDNAQQAGKEFVRAADLLPDRSDVQTKAAALLLAGQDFDRARKYAQSAVKADPKNVDAQLVLANALAGLKDTAGAIRELEQAMHLAPDDSRPYVSLGSLRAVEGKRDEAEAEFRKAVQIDPHSVNAKLALAYFLWATNRLAETEQMLGDALATDRDNALGNRMLAVFYLSQGRTSDAETPLLRLVNAKDTSATVTLADLYVRTERAAQARLLYESLKQQKLTRTIAVARLASLDYAANKREDAHRAVDEVLKKDANDTELLTLKSGWLLTEHRLDEALQTAQKASTTAPQSASAQFALGTAHLARGETDSAAKSFNDALRLNPRLIAAEIAIARIELAKGNADQSLQHALAARKIDPKSGDARLAVARALVGKGDLPSVETELKSLLADFPRSAAVHTLSGQVFLARRDGPGAVREFDKALDLNPSDLDALSGRLVADLQLKHADDARARVNRALAHDAHNSNLLIVAARLENTLGDPAAAERHLRKAIEVDPASLQAYTMLGRMYFQQHRLDEARQEFERIVRQRPDAIGERTMIGIILDAQNRHDESKKIYESIVGSTSRAPVAANNLAWIYADRGEQLDTALQLAQSAKEQMPDRAEVNDTLGWVYYKKNLPELAIRPLELSIAADPNNATYRFHLGLAYAKAGQREKARQALEQALKLKPDFAGADQARTALSSLKG